MEQSRRAVVPNDGDLLSARLSVALTTFDARGRSQLVRGYGVISGVVRAARASGVGEIRIGENTVPLRFALARDQLSGSNRSQTYRDSSGIDWTISRESNATRRSSTTSLRRNGQLVSRLVAEFSATQRGVLERGMVEHFVDGRLKSRLALEVVALDRGVPSVSRHTLEEPSGATMMPAVFTVESTGLGAGDLRETEIVGASAMEEGTNCFLLALKILAEAAALVPVCANPASAVLCVIDGLSLANDMADWEEDCGGET